MTNVNSLVEKHGIIFPIGKPQSNMISSSIVRSVTHY